MWFLLDLPGRVRLPASSWLPFLRILGKEEGARADAHCSGFKLLLLSLCVGPAHYLSSLFLAVLAFFVHFDPELAGSSSFISHRTVSTSLSYNDLK